MYSNLIIVSGQLFVCSCFASCVFLLFCALPIQSRVQTLPKLSLILILQLFMFLLTIIVKSSMILSLVLMISMILLGMVLSLAILSILRRLDFVFPPRTLLVLNRFFYQSLEIMKL